MSNVRAEGSGWHESHWFHWGWSAANPKRAHAAPAHQQNLPKHSLDAAGELAGQERASQLWHTTWISLLLCFVGLFSKAGLVVSFVWIFVLFVCLIFQKFTFGIGEIAFWKWRGTTTEKSVWEVRYHVFLYFQWWSFAPSFGITGHPPAQFPPTIFCKLFWVMNDFRARGLVWKTFKFCKLEKIPDLIKYMKNSVTSLWLCHQNKSKALLMLLFSRTWEIWKDKVNLTLTSVFYLDYPCSTIRFQAYSPPAESITFPDKTVFQCFRF